MKFPRFVLFWFALSPERKLSKPLQGSLARLQTQAARLLSALLSPLTI